MSYFKTVEEMVDGARRDEESPFNSIDAELRHGGSLEIVAVKPVFEHDDCMCPIRIDVSDFPALIALMWDILETQAENKEREKLTLWESLGDLFSDEEPAE